MPSLNVIFLKLGAELQNQPPRWSSMAIASVVVSALSQWFISDETLRRV